MESNALLAQLPCALRIAFTAARMDIERLTPLAPLAAERTVARRDAARATGVPR